MIEILDGMPAGAIGVRASGKLTSDDYERVLIPALQAHLKDNDGLRVVVLLDGDGHPEMTAGAMWDDFKVGITEARKWKRLAIVTDSDSMTKAIHALGWMIPGEVKTFTESDLEPAKTWVIE